MPREWQKLEIGPGWKGLLQRRMRYQNDPLYAAICSNVDFFAGALGKRPGTQIITGAGSYTTATGTTTTLVVADASGFAINMASTQSIRIIWGDGTQQFTRTIPVSGVSGNTITITSALPSTPPIGSAVILPGSGAFIDALFQAIFRDNSMFLLVAFQASLRKVLKGAPPVALTAQYPTTTTSGPNSTTTTIFLTTINGLREGDWIEVVGFGTARIKTIIPLASPPSAVILVSALSGAPGDGVTVRHVTSVRDGPAVAGDAHFVQFGNLTHYAQGQPQSVVWPMQPLKFNGTAVQRHGIGIHNEYMLLNVIAAGTGLALGAYNYRVRFYNSNTGEESEGSLLERSATIVAAATQVQLTRLPTTAAQCPDPQVTHVNIYRTQVNVPQGAGPWLYLTQVPIGGPTTFDDNVADAALGAAMRNFRDVAIPSTVRFLTTWGATSRLIGIYDPEMPVSVVFGVTTTPASSLVYSDLPDLATGFLKGESWPVNNQIFVGYDDGDKLVGVVSFFDSLLVFKERSVWRITGAPGGSPGDAGTLQLQPIHFRSDQTSVGCRAIKAVAADHDEVLFLGTDAVYHLNRFEGVNSGFRSERISQEIDELLLQFGAATKVAHAVYFRAKRQLRVFPNTSLCLVYQFEGGPDGGPMGWSTWTFKEWDDVPTSAPFGSRVATQVRASCIGRYDPNVVVGVGAASSGAEIDAYQFIAIGADVYQLDVGTADQGAWAIPVSYLSAPFAPGGRGNSARGRALDLVVAPYVTASPTFQISTDALAATVTIPVPFPGSTPFAANVLDLAERTLAPEIQVGLLCLAAGQWHQLGFTESDLASMYRIVGATYWYQALPPAMVKRLSLQTTLETLT